MFKIALMWLVLLTLTTNAAAQGQVVRGQADARHATTNASVSITTGNTFQNILAALTTTTDRQSLTIQNNNTNSDNCWVFIGLAASATKATAILLSPGGSYQRYWPYVPPDAIQATCTGNGDTLYVDWQ